MILLQAANKVLEETLRERFKNDQPDKLVMNASDFDGVSYRLSTPENKNILQVSMFLPCFSQVQQFGADEVLRRIYGDLVVAPEPGFDVTLRIDHAALPADKEPLIRQISLLKRNALAAPFEAAFAAQQAGSETSLMQVKYREEESFFIKGSHDRVTVIFSTTFKEETDKIFGKVFLQEFVDVRRQASVSSTPQVLYTAREPPLELQGVPGLKDSDDVAYVTFVLTPRHFTKDTADEAISRIQLFRDYFHYHIKASKAYMHSRMRTRVEMFLKVLNRAKPEIPDSKKEKKTASGKTFTRS